MHPIKFIKVQNCVKTWKMLDFSQKPVCPPVSASVLVTQKKSTSLLPSSNPESHSLIHFALAALVDSNPEHIGLAREDSRVMSPPNLEPIPCSHCSVVVWIQELLAFLFFDGSGNKEAPKKTCDPSQFIKDLLQFIKDIGQFIMISVRF
jgi:hypothetical protein